ncbi:signal peptidase II [Lutibacter sp. B2]|nr:signal peptidase II [Lutibacter sp. B2]
MNYVLVFVIVMCDQFTKYLAQTKLSTLISIPIIKNVFHLTYVRNVGAAFGIMQHKQLFFIVMTIVVITGIVGFSFKYKNMHKVVFYSLSLIVGGAIGNFIDRVRVGYVIDFFDFRIWPVFNIADISIVIGALLLAYYLIKIDTVNE